MIEKFTNCYQLSKTLRFSLIPVGNTEKTFNEKHMLEKDKQRGEDYTKVKTYIDRYHIAFINRVLSNLIIDDISEYSELYYKIGKSDTDNDAMDALEEKMRKQIAKALTSDQEYKSLFGKEMFKDLLPHFLTEADELATVKMFESFTTYFSGFNINRANMYSAENQTTAISHRCINDNLPKFLDNCKTFEKIKSTLPEDILNKLDSDVYETYGIYLSNAFSTDYFSFVLAQTGIDRYNGILGGYSCSDGTKIQGLNEYINLYNQQIAKKDKSKKLPLMKPLYKQILSEKESISFIPEKFKSDDEVLSSVNTFHNNTIKATLTELKTLFHDFVFYNQDEIYVTNGLAVTDLSNAVFGIWSAVSSSWNTDYENAHPLKKGKDPEKYYDEEQKAYKKIKSFSISALQKLGSEGAVEEKKEESIADHYSKQVNELCDKITENYIKAEKLLTNSYQQTKKLCSNDSAIELIKNYLDSVKELEHLLKPLSGSGKEELKDELFYGEYEPLFTEIFSVNHIYDKVRNYLTQKPYSKDKIKLNFDNPQLLGGWDKNKEQNYRTVLLRKDRNYYLAIMDKSNPKLFEEAPEYTNGSFYEKIEYKLLPGPNKMLPKVFFAKSNIDYFAPSDEILKIRSKETFKKGSNFNIDDCHKFIDFFKNSIQKHEDWSKFGFSFSPTSSYNDISEFYNEVKEQGYSITFKNISEKYIDSVVEKGELYLFKIHNKDFSDYSHGTPNIHTLYFKMLFDNKNLSDVVYQLNGGAEMFYRPASINENEKIVHPANQPLDNKNPENKNKTSTFKYELIKDKRFTKQQFSLHLPITLNFKAEGKNYINNDIRLALKEKEEQYVIGIDRGERNLIYICVIDSKGKIVEQISLNEIISDNNYKVDYRKLLDTKEKDRNTERKDWKTVENIKELKEGYISQVVHKICELVVKYDAVIALEDLNFGFKNGRFKVEKQVYQKFENMLISKLNYLVDKKANPDVPGGLLNAYQLTNKDSGTNHGKQNGIIFYIPAWLTSKIDPSTGFVDLLKPKYKNEKESKDFFNKFDDIRYNPTTDIFEFDLDYSKFERCSADFKKKWTVCTNGERIETFRNPGNNSQWDNRTVNLTEKFKELFSSANIDYRTDLKKAINEASGAEFYKELTKLLALTLQMRNSITNDVDVDYLISPVRNSSGRFYNSNDFSGDNAVLPIDADANGAYNIARKGLWAVNEIKNTPDDMIDKANLSIKNADWLKFAQTI